MALGLLRYCMLAAADVVRVANAMAGKGHIQAHAISSQGKARAVFEGGWHEGRLRVPQRAQGQLPVYARVHRLLPDWCAAGPAARKC